MRRKQTVGLLLALTLLAGLMSACGAQKAEVVDLEAETGPASVDLGALLDEGIPLAATPVMLSAVSEPNAPGTAAEKNDSAVIDYSNAKDGYIMVSWLAGGAAKIKVLLKGPGGAQYQYNLNTGGKYEAFPLSDGSGSYTVGVYQNIQGDAVRYGVDREHHRGSHG